MSIYQCEVEEGMEYQTIDSNWTIKPIAYCHYYDGYLTEKQIKVHGCLYKKNGFCKRLEPLDSINFFVNLYGEQLKEKINYHD